ncbi:MAG: elongation factor G [Nitrospina sp.]|jgi:elongation factor G|nr:elongation factor G [Nitrospina sp.]MBT3876311.1 elongation factor G [Nitrospina sp.]MBT4049973.1 elongation factor G [Nitrospina sp.]MBT4556627.1 elongation factor G [Nitrospina sp.]MBT5348890.1 elongation factor G [Nitrospina sp.]
MKQYKLQDIRNIGLVGHGGSGKTSLAEAILYFSGVSDRLGKVGDVSSVMDYDPDEIKCGHSIDASIAFCEVSATKLNLLDTPGSSNFISDTPACLRVVDGLVFVIGADEGVQFYTEKIWNWADQLNLPRIIFLNKLDHDRANVSPILETIKKKFKKTPVFMQLPESVGPNFSGIVDLIDNQYYSYDKGGKGNGKAGDAPSAIKDEVEVSHSELMEAVAEVDDELLELYLEHGELTEEEFSKGLKEGIENGQLIPVVCGSALNNVGTDLLLKAAIKYLPSPDLCAPVKAKRLKDDEEVSRSASGGEPTAGMVFKTIADPYAGKLTLFRMYSGSLKGDSSIYNSTQDANERVGQLYMLQGKNQIQVSEIPAGDMGTVAKLKSTVTGDTFSDAQEKVVFPPIAFPVPVFSRALVPKTRADEEKISNALHRLLEEDPSLTMERNAQTGQLLISGLGQVHFDVTLERLKRRFGVEVDVMTPKVPYRETIKGSTKVQGKYKKQTGGKGQFGDTWIEISSRKRGEGYLFEDKIVGGAVPKTYIPAVNKGIQEAMAQGIIAHYPMVDVKVRLYDGSYHNVDSSEMAFKIAGSLGFKKGVMDCKPILIEPIMNMEIVVPSDHVGDIMGDVNSKRGKIQGVDPADDTQTIRAFVPMAEVLNYAADLTSLTGGRGMFVMEFDHYEDVPEHLMKKIIEEANQSFEEKK